MIELSNDYIYEMDNRNGLYTLYRTKPDSTLCEEYCKGGTWIEIPFEEAAFELDLVILTYEQACLRRDKIEAGE